ncbi:hypothetical protein [Streptococcus marmotae]|uniref:hypothetical protein n=1 Tax=Streptococcus marmotae TaxID=1825069 RepID=UPI0008297673|nr:hypothetical protein [Streptococcus marmotae]
MINWEIGGILGRIGAALGGSWGAVIGFSFSAIQAYSSWLQSQSPYPYYITTTYIHVAQRKWKFVTEWCKNSDYTGYVETKTSYLDF